MDSLHVIRELYNPAMTEAFDTLLMLPHTQAVEQP